jgi:uncharacterized membrane protein YsdA (DUF1294 family)
MFANWEYWATLLKTINIEYVIAYLIIINLFTALLYKMDKRAAINRSWRIPESTLHLAMFAGGTLGALYGQKKIRHKNRKRSFKTIFTMLLIIQCIAVAYIAYV